MKPLLIFLLLTVIIFSGYWLMNYQPVKIVPLASNLFKSASTVKPDDGRKQSFRRLQQKVSAAKNFAIQKGFSTRFAFLMDMKIPSGKKRFFVYDFKKDTIIAAGLVAHGNCRSGFLEEKAAFSNVPECGCSSVGKYKVGYSYPGQFSTSFKLHGLDSSNSNAFKRLVVLHAYDCVPDEEVYPQPICNSLGCPMVSYKFLDKLTSIIEQSKMPILLWIYK